VLVTAGNRWKKTLELGPDLIHAHGRWDNPTESGLALHQTAEPWPTPSEADMATVDHSKSHGISTDILRYVNLSRACEMNPRRWRPSAFAAANAIDGADAWTVADWVSVLTELDEAIRLVPSPGTEAFRVAAAGARAPVADPRT
jgi:hypothetical protein